MTYEEAANHIIGMSGADPRHAKAVEEFLRSRSRCESGEDASCYYCGEACEPFSGNPSRWPIPLTHRDEPGKVKWHHIGCVTERLIENQ